MSLDYTDISVIDSATPSNGVAPYAGASADQILEVYGKLPRISDQKGAKYSIWREVQAKEIEGTTLQKLAGQGFISGGKVTKAAALVTEIEADTRFTSGGVTVRFTDVISYNEYVNGDNYVWASIRRTAAPFDASEGNVLDTYVLRLERTGTNSPPSDTHSLVAFVVVTAGDITSINDNPDGKYLCTNESINRPFYHTQSVAGSADVTLSGLDGLAEVLSFTGVLTGDIDVIVPLIPGLAWIVRNATTGAFSLTVKGATGTGVAVAQGKVAQLTTDGTNVFSTLTDYASIGSIPAEVPQWVKVTKTHAQFQAAALTNDIEIYSLPAGYVLHGTKIKHSTAFAGGAIASYTISVGVSGDLDRYHEAFDVFSAVSNTNMSTAAMLISENQGAATSIRAAAVATGANLDQSSAGSVDFWLLISKAT